jgi:hypothetical protein
MSTAYIRFGSLADLLTNSSLMAALERKADVQTSENGVKLRSAFGQKRPFASGKFGSVLATSDSKRSTVTYQSKPIRTIRPQVG